MGRYRVVAQMPAEAVATELEYGVQEFRRNWRGLEFWRDVAELAGFGTVAEARGALEAFLERRRKRDDAMSDVGRVYWEGVL